MAFCRPSLVLVRGGRRVGGDRLAGLWTKFRETDGYKIERYCVVVEGRYCIVLLYIQYDRTATLLYSPLHNIVQYSSRFLAVT